MGCHFSRSSEISLLLLLRAELLALASADIDGRRARTTRLAVISSRLSAWSSARCQRAGRPILWPVFRLIHSIEHARHPRCAIIRPAAWCRAPDPCPRMENTSLSRPVSTTSASVISNGRLARADRRSSVRQPRYGRQLCRRSGKCRTTARRFNNTSNKSSALTGVH